MPVGRTRRIDKHLPARVYLRHGAYYHVSKNGKWTRLGTTYPEALTALGRLLDSTNPVSSVSALIARYEIDVVAKRNVEQQSHLRHLLKNVRAVFGEQRPDDIEPHDIWQYWLQRGETQMARHEIGALSAVMTHGRRIGAVSGANPCHGLKLPKARARERYVTDAEFLLVRSVAPPMVAHAMNLALACGMDRSTILGLERRNLTDRGIEFVRRKTGERQLIEWTAELREIVDAIKAERPQLRQALVCNRRGRCYTPRGFGALWQDTMARALKAGLAERFHFHDLRAKSASDSESDQAAADRLGHRDVALTRRVYRRLPRVAAPLKILDKGG